MDFIVEWLWYLLAFLAGAVLAWLVVRERITARSEDEAFSDLPDSLGSGDRS